MENFGMATVVAITVIAYLFGEAVKLSKLDHKWIPVICGGIGGVLGIAGMIVMPEFPAGDFISAFAVGAVSGLAATGAHQTVKQLVDSE